MANCGWLKYILLIIILCFFSPMYIISDNILNCIKVLLFNKCLSAVNNVQEWTSHHSLCKLYTHNTNGRILNFDDYLTMYTLAIKDILLGSLHGVVESIRYFVMSFKVYLIYRWNKVCVFPFLVIQQLNTTRCRVFSIQFSGIWLSGYKFWKEFWVIITAIIKKMI